MREERQVGLWSSLHRRLGLLILGLSLVGWPLFAISVEARSNSACALRIVSAGFRLVGGASFQAALGDSVRRGQFVTNLVKDQTLQDGTKVFNAELFDGRDGRSESRLCVGSICIDPRTNKVRWVQFDPASLKPWQREHTRLSLIVAATDAAMAVYNLNRPDVGSYIQVKDAAYGGLTYFDGRLLDWYRVIIRDNQTSRDTIVKVAVDARAQGPIIQVSMDDFSWNDDLGFQQVGSIAARLVGGASMNANGVRRGNLVSNMQRRSSSPIQRAELYNGTNAGGRALATVDVRFFDWARLQIDQVDIRVVDNPSGSTHSKAFIDAYALDSALALYNVNRVDANPGIMVTSIALTKWELLEGRWLGVYTVTIQSPGAAGKPATNYPYEVWMDSSLTHPVLRVRPAS